MKPGGVYQGYVNGIVDGIVYVRIPHLGSRIDYPAEMVENPYTAGLITGTTSAHSHPLQPAPLAVDDRVLVAFVEGRQDLLAVIGRLP